MKIYIIKSSGYIVLMTDKKDKIDATITTPGGKLTKKLKQGVS